MNFFFFYRTEVTFFLKFSSENHNHYFSIEIFNKKFSKEYQTLFLDNDVGNFFNNTVGTITPMMTQNGEFIL